MSKLDPEQKKFIEDYLNDKPKVKDKNSFWSKAMVYLTWAAKAYLRYEEIQERRK